MNIKIFAVTPNPALDLSGHVPRIVPNEKNYVRQARIDPGGNGINAARMARRLGSRPIVLGFSGGPSGEQLERLLNSEEIEHRFTEIRELTRTNVTVTNDSDYRQTRLTFPGPTVSNKEVISFRQKLSKLRPPGLCILGGSVPNGCPRDFYPALVRLLSKNKLGVMVDVPATQLRAVLKAATEKLLLIKPNQSEFEELLGKRLRTDLSIAREACKLLSKSALVCISLGERGAIFAVKDEVWRIRAPRVPAKGCVGAGDSMVGAIAASLARSRLYSPTLIARSDVKEALNAVRLGTAAGAATAMTDGTALGDPRVIMSLYSKVTCHRIFKICSPNPR